MPATNQLTAKEARLLFRCLYPQVPKPIPDADLEDYKSAVQKLKRLANG
jgi:hypothetical protein